MSAQSVIKNFMDSLDKTSLTGTDALSEAVASVSKFSSWAELINTMVKDCAAYNKDGTAFLKDMCGIILDNDDTGAISGSDAGGNSTKTAESIVPESGSWNYPNSSTFTVSGLTVNIQNFDSLSDSAKWIVGALYTWWIKESLSLIKSSFGFSFTESGTSVKTLDVYFYDSSDGKLASSQYSRGQKSTELRLNINMHYYNDIDTSNPNGVGSSAALVTLDRTVAHELVHCIMSANVDYYENLPTSFKEGAAELVHGIDDKRPSQIKSLSESSSSLKQAMSGSGVDAYAAGYIALRYLAKQAAEGRDPATEISPVTTPTEDTVSSSAVTVSGTTMKVSGATSSDIWLGGTNILTGATNPYGNSSIVRLDASEMTDAHILAGNSNGNYIIAGTAGATIWGGDGGNDTLQGGSGRDCFWYSLGNGNDNVENFQTGAAGDILHLIGGGISNLYREGNNLVLNMNDGGTLHVATDDGTANNRVRYTADRENFFAAKIGNTNLANSFTYEGGDIYYLGGNNSDTVQVSSAGATVNLNDGHYSSVEVIDASGSAGGNLLFGDWNGNQIISGGNDSTLWGGEGSADDVLIGGAGKDVFRYGAGEGNDTIDNLQADDLLELYNVNLSDVTFTQETDAGILIGVGENVLTVNGQSDTRAFLADGSTFVYSRDAKAWSRL